jgi:putative membrane protein
MKNLITIINLSIIIGITTIFTQSDKLKTNDNKVVKSQKQTSEAETANTVKSDFVSMDLPTREKTKADEAVIDFLQEITEGRLMDLEEGKTAQQRATTRALKDYGSLIAKDQAEMLENLQKIAVRKRVSIPSWVGPEKAEALNELKELHGKFFDKKFIKMMMIDHKRDIKKLENAIQYGDADIQVFATRYLPVVQSHLDQIKALKKSH